MTLYLCPQELANRCPVSLLSHSLGLCSAFPVDFCGDVYLERAGSPLFHKKVQDLCPIQQPCLLSIRPLRKHALTSYYIPDYVQLSSCWSHSSNEEQVVPSSCLQIYGSQAWGRPRFTRTDSMGVHGRGWK